jgi:type IV pilus assembly protein PilA
VNHQLDFTKGEIYDQPEPMAQNFAMGEIPLVVTLGRIRQARPALDQQREGLKTHLRLLHPFAVSSNSATMEIADSRRCWCSQPRTPMNSARHGFTLVEIMIVVVIIGLLAAMAIPAFQKVRQNSQDKAVLNNARQMSAAADQYFLEFGVSNVWKVNLIGSSNYVKALNTVANEQYPDWYTQGITITIGGIAGVRTVTFAP